MQGVQGGRLFRRAAEGLKPGPVEGLTNGPADAGLYGPQTAVGSAEPHPIPVEVESADELISGTHAGGSQGPLPEVGDEVGGWLVFFFSAPT